MAATTHTKTLIEETPGGGLRVLMPTPRVGCVLVFLAAWLLGWVAGEFSALRALFQLFAGGFGAASLGGGLFLLVWLAGWTAGGLVAGFVFLLMLDGAEVLTFGDGIIRRRVEVFDRGLSWRYPIEKCSNFRPTGNGGEDDVKNFLSFDYQGPKGEKTIRTGSGLSETAAEEVAEKVWALYPSLLPNHERRRRERDAAAAAGNFVTDEAPDAKDAAAAGPAAPPIEPPVEPPAPPPPGQSSA